MVIIMKFRYKINEQSYVVVDDSTGSFVGRHYKNGCTYGLCTKMTKTLQEMENWIEELREVFNEPS